jgi:hypothetical protein
VTSQVIDRVWADCRPAFRCSFSGYVRFAGDTPAIRENSPVQSQNPSLSELAIYHEPRKRTASCLITDDPRLMHGGLQEKLKARPPRRDR